MALEGIPITGEYFLVLVATTLPVPGDIFMPMVVIGGGIGRLLGRLMVVAFPYGLRRNPLMPIYPGIHSMFVSENADIGDASLCGAVTRTVSVAMITFDSLENCSHLSCAESKVLHGSISRANLLYVWESQIGNARWKAEAMRPASDENNAIVDNDMNEQSDPRKSTILSEISRTILPIKRTKTENNLHSLHGQRNRSSSLNAGRGNFDGAEHGNGCKGHSFCSSTKNLATFRLHRSALKRLVGLFNDDRRLWEHTQLRCEINLPSSMLDSASFHLVQTTSLYKFHSLFSLLGVRMAYVTECWILVGVVALSKLRNAIEHTQAGELKAHQRFVDATADLIDTAFGDR
uniref:Ion_trans_2 domain-containing protein n=1 Tax=Ascaris lumbricoides TaxID=6252 RepID=A0A0M3HPB2_ASCLU